MKKIVGIMAILACAVLLVAVFVMQGNKKTYDGQKPAALENQSAVNGAPFSRGPSAPPSIGTPAGPPPR
jgi:hypothetical protein